MIERMIPPSIFSFDPLATVENTTLSPRSKTLKKASGEKPVLSMLEKYGAMNLHMVREGLRIYAHKTINAQKSLRRMQELNQVNKYTIFPPDPVLSPCDVYVLSPAMREHRGISRMKRSPHDYNMANIPYVLEKLVLCQWHLQMLKHMDGKEVMFNKTIDVEGSTVLVPSLVRIKTCLKRGLYLCAVPALRGRKKEAITSFVAQIAFLSAYFAKNRRRFPSCVIVVLSESEKQIEEIARLLSSVKETSGLYLLYAIDSLVADESVNPLQMLYAVRNENHTTQLDLMKLA